MEKELRKRIEKWTVRIKEKRSAVASANGAVEDQLRLADDYVSDSAHFLAQGKLVESFEALVYAWAIIETLERLGLVEFQNPSGDGSTLRRK